MMVDGRKSPVHVQVEKDTPVHVHLKKKKKKTIGIPTAVEERLKTSHDKRMSGIISKTSGHGRKAAASFGASKRGKKSASPTFIPPPGKTSKKPLAWEGDSHRLEVAPAGVGALRMEELSTDEEDELHSHIRGYERKIDSLMSEVGSLKTERAIREVEKKSEQLNASRRLIEEQEDEIQDWKTELKHTVKENEALRHSIEKYKEDAEMSRTETVVVRDEKDKLIKQLVQVEIDAKAASEQLSKMKDSVRKLREDKRMSAADVGLLTRERELLMQKLNEFEKTNRVVRQLLRENKNKEEDQKHMKQQFEVLLRKLTEADGTNERLRVEITERDRQIETLLTQVEADKGQAIAFRDLKKTMETTRAHLQNQLRSKEMEISRLTVQIRNLEQQLDECRLELEHIQGLVAAQRDKSSKEKEALKKAARAQKDRVLYKDSQIEEMDQKLAEKELQLVDAKKAENVLREKCVRIEEERSNTEAEIKSVRSRLKELQEIINTSDKASKSNMELLNSKLSTRSQEVASLRAENEQYRAEIAAMEERLHENEQKALNKSIEARSESYNLLKKMTEYDELVQGYKKQERLAEHAENMNTADSKQYELESSVRHYKSTLRDYRYQAVYTKKEVESLRETIKEQEDVIEEEKYQVNAYGKRVQELETSLSEYKSLVNEYRIQAEYSKDEIASLDKKLREQQDTLVKEKAQVNSSCLRVEELETSISEQKAVIGEYKKQAACANEEVAMLKSKLREQEAIAQKYKEEGDILRMSLKQKEDDLEKQNFQAFHTRGQIESLQACFNERKESLEKKIAQATTFEAEILQFKRSEKQYKRLIEVYRGQLNLLQAENDQLKVTVSRYENLIAEYKEQIEKYRREADEGRSRLYEMEQETQRVHQESALEAEKVKFKMSQRLSELEPLADLLKTTELRLQESQDRLLSYERRSSDHTKLIAELTQKVETQTDQMENMREKLRQKEDDNRAFQSKYELLERKLVESEHQNRELFSVISKKEESMNHSQQRMDDLRAENLRLTHQLEASISEARRQAESQREKAVAKERVAQARITDLEVQLSRATASAAQLKKAKDEAERRYNSKIFDMRDRLDQANSTTRSMQNYVAFLKSSYANVFDELEDVR